MLHPKSPASPAAPFTPCDLQDAAIQLALADCHWLDVYGGSASNQIALAESHEDTVDYPYTFVAAAITAYCPQHES